MRLLRIACRCAMASIVCGAQTAQADLLRGDHGGADLAASIFGHADLADAAEAPKGAFYTSAGAGPLLSVDSLTVDPVENVIHVADFRVQRFASIRLQPSAMPSRCAP